MFPIRDHNPSRTTPVVIYALIALNVSAFLLMSGTASDERSLLAFYSSWALTPATSDPSTYVTSLFLHGGPLHLAGNMLFLWIFGDNMEDEMGHLPFLGFYLVGGIAAGLTQTLSDPSSTIPMVGASGAIAAVMGGYLLLFPRARVDVLFVFIVFFRIIPVPAWIVLGIWFALQLFSGANTPGGIGGVAYWAHAGGFAAGIAVMVPFWLKLGGPMFWRRTLGHPPHPDARYRLSTTSVPKAGRRR